MADALGNSRADSYIRYRHYFREIWRFYEKPIARVSLALLLTVFAITFFAAFAISPTLNTIGELLRKIEDQKTVLAELEKKSAALATVQSEYAIAESSLPLLDEAIPETEDIEQLLLLIEGTAADHQLPLSNLQLQEDIIIDKPDPSQAGVPQELPMSLSLEATYPQLRDFLKDLVRLPRMVVVDSISFQEPREDQGQSSPTGTLLLNIRLRAYYQPPGTPQQSAPPSETDQPVVETEEDLL